jgi:two-component system chemotaxis response regulator CheY
MAKVLVVDDSKIMRLNVKRMLEKLGHEVIAEAENGFESIEKYEASKPDFVTMDITMPEADGIKDGIEAAAKIIEKDKAAKILMVTSHGEQDKVLRAIKNGAKGYMLKPIKEEELKSKINKLGFEVEQSE